MTLQSLEGLWKAGLGLGIQEFLVLPEQRYSYRDTCQTIRQICQLIDEQGLVAGDHIAICSADDFVVTATFLSCLFHGIVPVNLAVGTKSSRGDAILSSIDAKLLICDKEVLSTWEINCPSIITRQPTNRGLLGFGKRDVWPFEGLKPAGVDPSLPADNTALAYLLFTSGSTAAPTGVEISLGNLLANLESVGRITQLLEGDRVFNDLAMAHTDGLIHGPVLAFATRSAVVRAGGMQIGRLEDWLNTVRRERCTHFISVPFVWALICRLGAHDDYFDAPELKLLISSAARLDLSLWNQIETRFGKPLANEYGMTETVMAAFHAGPFEGMGKKGTIGIPAHCGARIDPTDPAKPDEGELLVKGDCIAKRYWKNPTRNQTSFTQDGWLRTGDIVHRDLDGNYDLRGRLKSVIISGGMNIHPDEVNEVLESHANVTGAVTVGVPNPDYGEVVVSIVEGIEGLDTRSVIEHARQNLEPIKVPKQVLFMEAIPRGASGKPQLDRIQTYLKEHGSSPKGQNSDCSRDVSARIFQIAAPTFGCEASALSDRSQQDDVPGWDSFSQLTLYLAIEEEFSIRLPNRRLTSVRSLGELSKLVTEIIK